MPWKMDGENIAQEGGNPVWIEGDREVAVDYSALSSKLTETTRESVKRKERIREMEERLSVLEDIENPAEYLAKARKALETVKNLDDKQLVDAGKVEEVKAEVQKVYEAKLADAAKRADEAEATLQREMIGGRFARSKYIADKVAVPTDMIEAVFGRHFSIEDGKVVAKGHDGQKLYSREKPGETAEFDEALSILVDGYANKAAILKGSTASGGGAAGGSGGGAAGAKTITRAAFENLDPVSQVAFMRSKGVVTD